MFIDFSILYNLDTIINILNIVSYYLVKVMNGSAGNSSNNTGGSSGGGPSGNGGPPNKGGPEHTRGPWFPRDSGSHLNPQQAGLYSNEDLAEHLELAKDIELARRASLGIKSRSVSLSDIGIRLNHARGSHSQMCFALKKVLDANDLSANPFCATIVDDLLIMVVRGSIVV